MQELPWPWSQPQEGLRHTSAVNTENHLNSELEPETCLHQVTASQYSTLGQLGLGLRRLLRQALMRSCCLGLQQALMSGVAT